jgi:hypothetical protein
MADIEDNRKRAMPEPVSHAMIISDFPGFKLKVDFLDLVKAQMEASKRNAESDLRECEIVADKEGIRDKIRKINRGLDLLHFLQAWTENRHSIEGIEEVKEKFKEEAGSTREAISKAGIIKEVGEP